MASYRANFTFLYTTLTFHTTWIIISITVTEHQMFYLLFWAILPATLTSRNWYFPYTLPDQYFVCNFYFLKHYTSHLSHTSLLSFPNGVRQRVHTIQLFTVHIGHVRHASVVSTGSLDNIGQLQLLTVLDNSSLSPALTTLLTRYNLQGISGPNHFYQ